MEVLRTDVQTETKDTDKIQAVTLLYDGAVNFIRIAKEKLEQGDSTGKALYIKKASAIVTELSNSLNMDGGEIARNLKNLYDFVLVGLYQANANGDIKAIENAERIIEIIRDAWKEMQQVSQL